MRCVETELNADCGTNLGNGNNNKIFSPNCTCCAALNAFLFQGGARHLSNSLVSIRRRENSNTPLFDVLEKKKNVLWAGNCRFHLPKAKKLLFFAYYT